MKGWGGYCRHYEEYCLAGVSDDRRTIAFGVSLRVAFEGLQASFGGGQLNFEVDTRRFGGGRALEQGLDGTEFAGNRQAHGRRCLLGIGHRGTGLLGSVKRGGQAFLVLVQPVDQLVRILGVADQGLERFLDEVATGMLGGGRLRFPDGAVRALEDGLALEAVLLEELRLLGFRLVVLAVVGLTGFDPEMISKHFVPLQRKIVSNLTFSLKKSGTLVFITCSIFEKENEGNIRFFEKNLGLQLISSNYLEGSKSGADTLFVARLKKKG